MDWVHCNACFKQPFSGEPHKFFLTSCGHIYCELCLNSENNEKCKVCGNLFTATPLSNQMQPEVQEYFQNPTDQLKKLVQVIQFQDGHRQKFVFQSKQISAKYKAAKEEMKKLFDANKVLKRKNKELELEIENKKRKNKELELEIENKNKELELVKRHYQKQRPPNEPAPVHRNIGHNNPQHHFNAPMSIPSQSPRNVSSNNLQTTSHSNTLRTPNRLTLPNNNGSTPQTTISPANSSTNYMSASTPNKSCDKRNEQETPIQRRHQLKMPHTPQSTQPAYLDQYRSRDFSEHYSSQPNTPAASLLSSGYKSSKSPMTPAYSPNIQGRAGMSPLLTHSIYAGRPPLTPPTTGIELINLYSQKARSGQK